VSAAFACLAVTEHGSSAPARTDDLNNWVTGLCMLYCRRDGVRVLCLGPVHAPGAQGQMYGCGQCIAELDYMIYRQSCREERDEDCPKSCAAAAGSDHRWWRWKR
jgi:hypothetical protein